MTILMLQAEVNTEIRLGAGQLEANNKTATGYTIGIGMTRYFESDFLFGVDFDFTYADIEFNGRDRDLYGYGADLRLGYAFMDNDLSVYAIGSALRQTIGNTTGAGFGYGFGGDYHITNSMALALEYKTYDITTDKASTDYDFESVNGSLKFIF